MRSKTNNPNPKLIDSAGLIDLTSPRSGRWGTGSTSDACTDWVLVIGHEDYCYPIIQSEEPRVISTIDAPGDGKEWITVVVTQRNRKSQAEM